MKNDVQDDLLGKSLIRQINLGFRILSNLNADASAALLFNLGVNLVHVLGSVLLASLGAFGEWRLKWFKSDMEYSLWTALAVTKVFILDALKLLVMPFSGSLMTIAAKV